MAGGGGAAAAALKTKADAVRLAQQTSTRVFKECLQARPCWGEHGGAYQQSLQLSLLPLTILSLSCSLLSSAFILSVLRETCRRCWQMSYAGRMLCWREPQIRRVSAPVLLSFTEGFLIWFCIPWGCLRACGLTAIQQTCPYMTG